MNAPGPAATLTDEVINVLKDLNPWWERGRLRRPPPSYLRRGVPALLQRMLARKGLIEVVRGPRQVGKTTAIEQIIQEILKRPTRPTDILFVRFDQELLRESQGGLLPIVRWFEKQVRGRPF